MTEKMIHTVNLPIRIIIFFTLLYSFCPAFSFAQCTATVNIFPYNENFETSNGNWVAGGIGQDWAWGTPAKKTISSAGSGLKCWITGGLNKPAYNPNQNAWLKSPCFNFTNLKDPYIKFKVFWETAAIIDGANLQYSTDNGANWQLVGSANETNNCLTEKWYNASSVTDLSNQDAWCGNIQFSRPGCFVSGGSINWVTAKHAMPNLAGKSNVIFRFVFGSGAACTDFDGFAIDDFTIEEAPASAASFSYSCSSNLRVNFTSTASLCPIDFLWDFGDPASGLENTSTSQTPTHAYTFGGNYKVSLTVYGPGNNSSTFVLPNLQIIADIKAVIVTPIRCHDDTTGSLTVDFAGDSSGVSYSWNSNPVQNFRTATHLGAGDFNITILNKEGCPASANISLGEPPPLLHSESIVKPDCTASNGSVSITMSGGTAPYNFSWSPNVSNSSVAKNLPSGIYTVTVTDNNQCYKVLKIDLPGAGSLAAALTESKDVSCFGGNDGSAMVTANGGNAPYTYSWPSLGINTPMAANLNAGSYAATITDAKGCKAFATAVINQPKALISGINIQNTSCGNNNGSATVTGYGGTGPYQYTWSPGNYTNASVNNLAPGKYYLTIKDIRGCIKNDTALVAPSTAVHVELSHNDVLCAGNKTGFAEALLSGGTQPYSFQWKDTMQSFSGTSINNLGAGIYNFSVQDAVGCSINTSVLIKEPEAIKIDFDTQPSYCGFSNGNASAFVSGGVQPYSFLWSSQPNRTAVLSNVHAGNYLLTVTDKNSCTVSLLTTILNTQPENIFIGNDTTLCPGNQIILSPGNYTKYRWQDNSSAPNFTVTKAGSYFVHVTDALGCVIKDTIKITGDCGYIFFPTAFTPNNDLRNDFFGPVGVLSTVKDYTLVVYNRLGQLVFKSNDPFKKWNGKLQNLSPQSGTYVWIATYSNKGTKGIVQKGTVTVIY